MIISKILLVTLLLSFSASLAFSSSIDYRGNQSADYIRSMNRNASLDGADIVYYNPAGTSLIEDGVYFNIGNQFIIKDYSMELDATGDEFSSDVPTLILPNFYSIYKQDNWAGFIGVGVPAGGGSVEYADGIAYTQYLYESYPTTAPYSYLDKASLEATSMYFGGILGGSYSYKDMVSLSLSGRAVYGTKDILLSTSGGTALLDVSQSAMGFGGIIGLDFKPMNNLNIGVKYETKTALNFENDTEVENAGFAQYNDGESVRKDLPAMLAVGVAYNVTSEFGLNLGFNYYFIKDADSGSSDGYDDDYDNGFDLAGGVEYKVNTQLLVSAGYLYSDTGANEDTVSDFDMTLDTHSFSLGGKYAVKENIDVTLGFNYSPFVEMSNSYGTYNKATYLAAIGANVKL